MGRTAILYIAERCNQSCVFCLEEDNSWTEFVDPSTTAVADQIERLWKLGARHITFMGGETFFRKDLGRLLAHARDVGFTRVGVTTNGTVLSKKGFLRNLVDHGLAFIELSIHGHTPELANSIGGTHFTFERQADAMAELDEMGSLSTIVNIVVIRENKDHLRDIARYICETYPRIPVRFKLKFVSLQGLAAESAVGSGTALAYSDVDFISVGDYLAERGVPCWFYNVPLCRLGPHAAQSHELSSLAADENYFDFEHRGDTGYYDSGYQLEGRVWPEPTCARCTFRPFCPGLEETYRRAHGAAAVAALSARADDPLHPLRVVLADRGFDISLAEARLEVLSLQARPSRFVRPRPEGALRFEHTAEPEPLDVLIEEQCVPPRRSFAQTARFTLSYRNWAEEDPAQRPSVTELLAALVVELGRAEASRRGIVDARAAVARTQAAGWTVDPTSISRTAARPRNALPLLAAEPRAART